MIDNIVDLVKYIAELRRSGVSSKSVNDQINLIDGAINATARNSLVNKARANICQFPILFSSNVASDTMYKLTQTIEKLYSSYIYIAITNQAELIRLDQNENKQHAIARIHQNDVPNYGLSTANDVKDTLQSAFASESYTFSVDINLNENILIEANKSLSIPYKDNFSNMNLNFLTLNEATEDSLRVTDIYDVIEAYRQKYFHEIGEALKRGKKNDPDSDPKVKAAKAKYQAYLSMAKTMANRNKDSGDNSDVNAKKQQLAEDNEIINDYITDIGRLIDEYKNGKISERDLKNYLRKHFDSDDIRVFEQLSRTHNGGKINYEEMLKNLRESYKEKIDENNNKIAKLGYCQVTHASIKRENKSNDLEPTILHMNIKYATGNSGHTSDTELMVGVKAISHYIPYPELIFYLPNSLIKNKKLFRFIQWTTGEIKASDFFFDLSGAKFDAKNEKKMNSIKWFRHLKARSLAAKKRALLNKSEINPNCSLVITTEDVVLIKEKSRIDLIKDTKYAKKLMDIFFLIGFYIVDEVNQEVMVFNNGNGGAFWETYSLKKYEDDSLKNYIKTISGKGL